jgi:hypothetical protein
MVLNRRLPGITARAVLPIVALGNLIHHPLNVWTNATRVETFSGAARLKRFAVLHAPRQISRGLLGTIQSGSPPDAPDLPVPALRTPLATEPSQHHAVDLQQSA